MDIGELDRLMNEGDTFVLDLMDKCEEAVIKRAAEDAYIITDNIENHEAQKAYYETVLLCIRRGARLMVEEMTNMLKGNKQ